MRDAVCTVFAVLAKHIARGQAEKTARALPGEIRALWLSPANGGSETPARTRVKEQAAT